jgi:hypothetical protein
VSYFLSYFLICTSYKQKDYVTNSMFTAGNGEAIRTTNVRLNNGCDFVAQNNDGSYNCTCPWGCANAKLGGDTTKFGNSQPTQPRKGRTCPDPHEFSPKEVSEWLLTNVGLAGALVDKSFMSESIDGSFMRGMLRSGRELGAAEADLRELGVSSRITQSKIIGKWMNLAEKFASCRAE